jgi:hypothetical protein
MLRIKREIIRSTAYILLQPRAENSPRTYLNVTRTVDVQLEIKIWLVYRILSCQDVVESFITVPCNTLQLQVTWAVTE